jgi:large subunit ribosomal protein L22
MGMSATLKHFRMSARKVRLVADQIRGKSYEEAVGILTFLPKQKASEAILKVLKSAAANAEDTSDYSAEELYVRKVEVDGARMLKRFRPAPQGRAMRVRKRMSHITVVLGAK